MKKTWRVAVFLQCLNATLNSANVIGLVPHTAHILVLDTVVHFAQHVSLYKFISHRICSSFFFSLCVVYSSYLGLKLSPASLGTTVACVTDGTIVVTVPPPSP